MTGPDSVPFTGLKVGFAAPATVGAGYPGSIPGRSTATTIEGVFMFDEDAFYEREALVAEYFDSDAAYEDLHEYMLNFGELLHPRSGEQVTVDTWLECDEGAEALALWVECVTGGAA